MKLTLEVIRGVREVVGPKFPIVVRWSPIDFIKSPAGPGLSMEDALRIAPMLEEAGCDLHDLSVGWHETSEPLTTKPSRTATGRSSRSRSRPWRRNRWRRGIATPIRA